MNSEEIIIAAIGWLAGMLTSAVRRWFKRPRELNLKG